MGVWDMSCLLALAWLVYGFAVYYMGTSPDLDTDVIVVCVNGQLYENEVCHWLTEVRLTLWCILNKILTYWSFCKASIFIFFCSSIQTKLLQLNMFCCTFLFSQNSFETLNLWFYCYKIPCMMYDSVTPWNSICNLISFHSLPSKMGTLYKVITWSPIQAYFAPK